MKRKKNLVIVVSVIVFVCVLLLGINTAFSVSRIDADFALFSESARNDSAVLQKELEKKYKGKLLFFVNKEKVEKEFDDYPYLTVMAIEKDFPDKIKIFVEEKKEQYAFVIRGETETQYYVTDSEGGFLRRGTDIANNADGGGNFVIEGLTVGENGTVAEDRNYDTIMQMCRVFDSRTGGIRTCLESLTLLINPDGSTRVTVHTAEGVTVYIYDIGKNAEKKAEAAMDVYLRLSDVNKLYGRIMITNNANDPDGINSAYSPTEN